MKELREILEARARDPGVPYALATVVRVEGSSYRRPGARMLVSVAGRVAGSVSGGCLERDVVRRGIEAIVSNRPALVSYDTNDQDDLALGASLGCQGTIEILIQPVPPGAWPLEEVVSGIVGAGKAAAVAIVYRGPGAGGVLAGGLLPEPLRDEAREIASVRRARSVSWETPDGTASALVEKIAPPLRLLLFGGGHDVPPLVRLAKELGHHVTVVDRRPEFAAAGAFPGADAVVCARADQAAALAARAEGEVATVVMNHHYETDRDLLGLLLPLGLAYVGMLGPRKRTERALAELGHAAPVPASLHAPAGLDIGSGNPEQIALAILAEIQAVLAGRPAVFLSRRPGPIHPPEAPLECLPSS